MPFISVFFRGVKETKKFTVRINVSAQKTPGNLSNFRNSNEEYLEIGLKLENSNNIRMLERVNLDYANCTKNRWELGALESGKCGLCELCQNL